MGAGHGDFDEKKGDNCRARRHATALICPAVKPARSFSCAPGTRTDRLVEAVRQHAGSDAAAAHDHGGPGEKPGPRSGKPAGINVAAGTRLSRV